VLIITTSPQQILHQWDLHLWKVFILINYLLQVSEGAFSKFATWCVFLPPLEHLPSIINQHNDQLQPSFQILKVGPHQTHSSVFTHLALTDISMQCKRDLYRVSHYAYRLRMLHQEISHLIKLNAFSIGLNSGVYYGRVIAWSPLVLKNSFTWSVRCIRALSRTKNKFFQ